jgi:hypothetical protein
VPLPDGTVSRFPHIIESRALSACSLMGGASATKGNGYHEYIAAMLRVPRQRRYRGRHGVAQKRPPSLCHQRSLRMNSCQSK